MVKLAMTLVCGKVCTLTRTTCLAGVSPWRSTARSDVKRQVRASAAAMAGALDLAVIAEGVESEAQRVLAATEGCAFYQGFLRAQPMGAAEFSALTKSSSRT